MGCCHSCSIPCCQCCICDCCPFCNCCGCWCQDGRWHCKSDLCITSGTRTEEDTNSAETDHVENNCQIRYAKRYEQNVDQNVYEKTMVVEIVNSDHIVGTVSTASSPVSQSTSGMEPQVSDESRPPSTVTGSEESITNRSETNIEGVCIEGKFHVRPKSPTPPKTKTKKMYDDNQESAISSIITVKIADKKGQSAKKMEESSIKESIAPRRLAKIDIKEERRKIMTELSRFRRKNVKRRKLNTIKGGNANMAFGHVESVTHMQVLDSDPGGDSSGSPSLHISSASEEGDFPSESSAPRLQNVRTIHVTSSSDGLSDTQKNSTANVRTIHVTSSSDGLSDTQKNFTVGSATSVRKNDADVPPTVASTSNSPTPAVKNAYVAIPGSTVYNTMDSEMKTNVGELTSSKMSKEPPTSHQTDHSQTPDFDLSLHRISRTQSSSTRGSSCYSSRRASIGLPSGLLSTVPTPSSERARRGVAMSRHFQCHRQTSSVALQTSTSPTTAALFTSSGSGSATRPLSGLSQHQTRGARLGNLSSRCESTWTLRPRSGASGETLEDGSCDKWSVCSANNSDQDSSTSRPSSNYGIRAHGDAVKSLRRWRNMKVNPF